MKAVLNRRGIVRAIACSTPLSSETFSDIFSLFTNSMSKLGLFCRRIMGQELGLLECNNGRNVLRMLFRYYETAFAFGFAIHVSMWSKLRVEIQNSAAREQRTRCCCLSFMS